MTNIFEKATRKGLRFNYRGLITVEDLWALNLHDLDSIYKGLMVEKKETVEESLMGTENVENEELALKIDIIKHIFAVLTEEKQIRENAQARKEEKQRILTILADKKDEEMKNLSVEELQELAQSL